MDPATIMMVSSMITDWFGKSTTSKNAVESSELMGDVIASGQLENVLQGVSELMGVFKVSGPAMSELIAKIKTETIGARTNLMMELVEIVKQPTTAQTITQLSGVLSKMMTMLGSMAGIIVNLTDFHNSVRKLGGWQTRIEQDIHELEAATDVTGPENPTPPDGEITPPGPPVDTSTIVTVATPTNTQNSSPSWNTALEQAAVWLILWFL